MTLVSITLSKNIWVKNTTCNITARRSEGRVYVPHEHAYGKPPDNDASAGKDNISNWRHSAENIYESRSWDADRSRGCVNHHIIVCVRIIVSAVRRLGSGLCSVRVQYALTLRYMAVAWMCLKPMNLAYLWIVSLQIGILTCVASSIICMGGWMRTSRDGQFGLWRGESSNVRHHERPYVRTRVHVFESWKLGSAVHIDLLK